MPNPQLTANLATLRRLEQAEDRDDKVAGIDDEVEPRVNLTLQLGDHGRERTPTAPAGAFGNDVGVVCHGDVLSLHDNGGESRRADRLRPLNLAPLPFSLGGDGVERVQVAVYLFRRAPAPTVERLFDVRFELA